MTKNVFITGGSGQDCKILTILLQNRNINLNVFYRKNKPFKISGVKYIQNNLSNKAKIDKIFSKIKPDIVLHLASNNPAYLESGYNKFYKQNSLATKNIFKSTFETNLNAKFIFCSSSQIFKNKNGLVSEKSKFSIKSDYTNFRIKSDSMMLKYKKDQKISYTNVILFNHDSIYRNAKFVIPRTIKALINKNFLFIKKIIKANIYEDFSHAEDICKGLIKIMFSKKNFDRIILSSGKATHLNDIIMYICKKNNIKVNFQSKKNRLKKALIGNNKFAKKEFNWLLKKNIFVAANEIYRSLLKK